LSCIYFCGEPYAVKVARTVRRKVFGG